MMLRISLIILCCMCFSVNAIEVAYQCDKCTNTASIASSAARQSDLATGDILNVIDFSDYTTSSFRINSFPNARDPS